jgi:hypothetical protein
VLKIKRSNQKKKKKKRKKSQKKQQKHKSPKKRKKMGWWAFWAGKSWRARANLQPHVLPTRATVLLQAPAARARALCHRFLR